ncbi:hypothetical protein Q8A67_019772 [Cirrhinus molitorella]|uniref:Uncharacterized protein n=1 Tax=Cirrhinus molitorella TaxID=172907 RepID=A0AA88TGN1_9TELE|nr:hypothetical protein Q8A67_019772 [Cirrhinus molitorella]
MCAGNEQIPYALLWDYSTRHTTGHVWEPGCMVGACGLCLSPGVSSGLRCDYPLVAWLQNRRSPTDVSGLFHLGIAGANS